MVLRVFRVINLSGVSFYNKYNTFERVLPPTNIYYCYKFLKKSKSSFFTCQSYVLIKKCDYSRFQDYEINCGTVLLLIQYVQKSISFVNSYEYYNIWENKSSSHFSFNVHKMCISFMPSRPNWMDFLTEFFEYVVWGLLSSDARVHRSSLCALYQRSNPFESATWFQLPKFTRHFSFLWK